MNNARTFQTIEEQDLREVLRFSEEELRRFLEEAGAPAGKFRGYRDRLLAVCLVQGVAQHFVDTHLQVRTDHEIEVSQSKIAEKGAVDLRTSALGKSTPNITINLTSASRCSAAAGIVNVRRTAEIASSTGQSPEVSYGRYTNF